MKVVKTNIQYHFLDDSIYVDYWKVLKGKYIITYTESTNWKSKFTQTDKTIENCNMVESIFLHGSMHTCFKLNYCKHVQRTIKNISYDSENNH